jgi:hypothetical protein
MNEQPTRTVENNLLFSEALPPVTMKIDDAFDYVGRLQFILYDLADVDLFVFAVPGPAGEVERLLLVQFERFLDDNERTYNYNSPLTVLLGDHEYQYNSAVVHIPSMLEERPDSDSARALALLHEKGYQPGDDYIYTRFVRLIDEARRKELLFSYSENLNIVGLTAGDLSEGGRAAGELESLSKGVFERALKVVQIVEG